MPKPVGKKLGNIMANLKDFSSESKLNNLTKPQLDKDFLDISLQ